MCEKLKSSREFLDADNQREEVEGYLVRVGQEEILCYFDTGDFGWCETAMEEGDYDYEAVPWGYCSFHCQLPYTKYGHSLFGTDVR